MEWNQVIGGGLENRVLKNHDRASGMLPAG